MMPGPHSVDLLRSDYSCSVLRWLNCTRVPVCIFVRLESWATQLRLIELCMCVHLHYRKIAVSGYTVVSKPRHRPQIGHHVISAIRHAGSHTRWRRGTHTRHHDGFISGWTLCVECTVHRHGNLLLGLFSLYICAMAGRWLKPQLMSVRTKHVGLYWICSKSLHLFDSLCDHVLEDFPLICL